MEMKPSLNGTFWCGAVIVLVCLHFCCRVTQAVTMSLDHKAVKLNEKETTAVQLARAECTPSPPSTQCSVSLDNVFPSNPCGSCFGIYPCSTPSDGYCLRFLPGQGTFNPCIQSRYSLTLRASDDSGSVTSVVDVHIKPNAPPFFDPDQFQDKQLHVTAKLTNGGSVQYQATDEDGDPLTYSMTTVPSVDVLQIDSLTGTISATSDLGTLCRSYVTALVYAKDSHHTESAGPLAVTLEIDNPNRRPMINNLNTDVYVREDEAVGTVALPLAVYDSDGDDLTFTLSAVPSTASDLFEINPTTQELRVKGALDHESYPSGISLNVQVSDGRCESQVYTLKVHVVDINEPPTLLPIDQTLDSCEGLTDITPDWTEVSDPDEGDVVRFVDISPNDNGRFRIDETTGKVSTTIDYDLDEAELPATVTNIVTLEDSQGLTATATLTIRFADCNDNPPVFPVPARDYLVRDCWAAGTVVGSVPNAEDVDSSFRQNNVFSHSGSGAGAQVLESGAIVIQQQFSAGQTVTFPVYATDKGEVPGPLTSKAFYVSLYTLPCIVPDPVDPDATTTDATNRTLANDVGFWDADGPNLGWLIAALLLALALAALTAFLLWRYWPRIRACCARPRSCFGSSRRKDPPRTGSPTRRPTPPPEKRKPGFIFGWWKEEYTNADYDHTPNRNALPEPSKGPELVDTNTYNFEPDPPLVQAPPSTPPPRESSCHIL
ncbi:neural-cadherin-like [Babylonia areolata]|uniref:neural-cadherin-like n=1 Tax=Babylonia areolata TaxID=304850 RepID=UPI003FD3F853